MALGHALTSKQSSSLPVLAIVGRPNVGKSAFFNRLIRGKKAIVDNLPGVTRDRNYGEAEWLGKKFLLIDTGGFESDAASPLERQIQEQSRLAIEEADVIVFLFDGKAGLNPLDRDAVGLLRKVQKPVFFVVNKIDTPSKENNLYEFYALGLPEIFPVSAEHGLGLSELMDRVKDALPAHEDREVPEESKEKGPPRVAIVGRPNAGKSTLVNRLLGYERSVVDPRPGTTRDALDSPFTIRGKPYILVDTAGIRRKARISDRIERYSVIRSLRTVDQGDLIVHLLDGPEGVTDQDAQILAYAFRRGKALILAVNKWDLVTRDRRKAQFYADEVRRQLSFLEFAPLQFISAQTGYGLEALLEATARVLSSYRRKVPTSRLNQVLQEVVKSHTPPLHQGRAVKFYYATQTGVCPPTLTLFVNFPKGVPVSYERYLVHQLREALSLQYSPVRLILRARREERKKR